MRMLNGIKIPSVHREQNELVKHGTNLLKMPNHESSKEKTKGICRYRVMRWQDLISNKHKREF